MTFDFWDTSSSDRLLVAVGGAVILHFIILFGLHFEVPKAKPPVRNLEIELVDQSSEEPVKDADYLAQANNQGGGDSQKINKPKLPPQAASAPPQEKKPLQSTQQWQRKHTKKAILTRDHANHKVQTQEPLEEIPAQPRLDTRQLAHQIAELGIASTKETDLATKQKVLPLNAITSKKYVAAAYERAWQKKVERIGNLNYPDQARRQNLSGRLLISVWVAKDGSVKKIKVHKSSGHKILDDAAVRIVRLAAPFAPLPKELASQADIIVITRTWKFEAGLAMGR
ncbi:MAG: hypothetical protein AXA67_09760 [Methylothermaceae bacteria B42]|nr:MAG: hypothetical protein AXA67_09760 [Methylothermaceae bacteria B42]HHJ39589.1 energy transducer TonB [Methylothermaceae bacterium]